MIFSSTLTFHETNVTSILSPSMLKCDKVAQYLIISPCQTLVRRRQWIPILVVSPSPSSTTPSWKGNHIFLLQLICCMLCYSHPYLSTCYVHLDIKIYQASQPASPLSVIGCVCLFVCLFVCLYARRLSLLVSHSFWNLKNEILYTSMHFRYLQIFHQNNCD